MGDSGWSPAFGDQVLAVALDVFGSGQPGVDAVLATPVDPGRELTAVAAHGVGRGVAVGHVQAQEAGEGGVQILNWCGGDQRRVGHAR